jgi:hypothetical protein
MSHTNQQVGVVAPRPAPDNTDKHIPVNRLGTFSQVRSPVRKTGRCFRAGTCLTCFPAPCRLPIFWHAEPLELTVEFISKQMEDIRGGAPDEQLVALLGKACEALKAGSLEQSEQFVEAALEVLSEIQNRSFADARSRTDGVA